MVMPGDNVDMEQNADHPDAMDEKLRFAIREGRPHRRLSGVVPSILSDTV